MDRKLTLAILTGGSNNSYDFLLPPTFEGAANTIVGAMSHGGLISAPPIGKGDRELLRKLVGTKTVYENSKWDKLPGSYLLVLHVCVHDTTKEPFLGISTLILYRVNVNNIGLVGEQIEVFLSKVRELSRNNIFDYKEISDFLDLSDRQ